jgi:methionyl-tRNA formyltransferase
MKTKVCVLTSRPIGKKCQEWAQVNMPEGFQYCESMHESDIIISVLYDRLISDDIVSQKKCFNFHPGILPYYRGAGCCSWVIINGETESGVTLHFIDSGIDTGDIIDIRKFTITDSDTAYTVNDKSNDALYSMFVEYFKDILLLKVVGTPQPQGGKTYYRKDLEKAKDLTKYVRAFTFDGKESAYYIYNNHKHYIGEINERN